MDKYDRLVRSLMLVTLLLIVEAVLGVYVASYVKVKPITTSFATYMSGSPILAAHMILAFVLVITAFMAFFMAIHARIGNKYIFASMVAFISVVLAGVSGLMYLMAGQTIIYAYLMTGFMLAAFAGTGMATSGTRKAKS